MQRQRTLEEGWDTSKRQFRILGAIPVISPWKGLDITKISQNYFWVDERSSFPGLQLGSGYSSLAPAFSTLCLDSPERFPRSPWVSLAYKSCGVAAEPLTSYLRIEMAPSPTPLFLARLGAYTMAFAWGAISLSIGLNTVVKQNRLKSFLRRSVAPLGITLRLVTNSTFNIPLPPTQPNARL